MDTGDERLCLPVPVIVRLRHAAGPVAPISGIEHPDAAVACLFALVVQVLPVICLLNPDISILILCGFPASRRSAWCCPDNRVAAHYPVIKVPGHGLASGDVVGYGGRRFLAGQLAAGLASGA
jgi:hypothetical protein